MMSSGTTPVFGVVVADPASRSILADAVVAHTPRSPATPTRDTRRGCLAFRRTCRCRREVTSRPASCSRTADRAELPIVPALHVDIQRGRTVAVMERAACTAPPSTCNRPEAGKLFQLLPPYPVLRSAIPKMTILPRHDTLRPSSRSPASPLHRGRERTMMR